MQNRDIGFGFEHSKMTHSKVCVDSCSGIDSERRVDGDQCSQGRIYFVAVVGVGELSQRSALWDQDISDGNIWERSRHGNLQMENKQNC